jgi:hypothetical protein
VNILRALIKYVRARPAVASLLLCLLLVKYFKTPTGELLGRFSDHLHHAHAAWTFFKVGFPVYTHPFAETAVAYPHPFPSWPQFPLVYPLGMFVAFAPPMLLGRFVPMSMSVFGAWLVAYVTVCTHGFLHVFHSILARRTWDALSSALFFFVWLFCAYIALLGFYDGLWLMCGALAVRAMTRGDSARAVIWCSVAATLSFRAVSLGPIGVWAFVSLWRSDGAIAKKVWPTLVAAVVSVTTLICFAVAVRYSPHSGAAAEGSGSKYLPISFYGYALVVVGMAMSVVALLRVDRLTGISMALSTLLSVAHAGHTWHGAVCVAPVLTYAVAAKHSRVGPFLIFAWYTLFIEMAFDFTPGRVVHELIRLFEHNGVYPT